MRKGDAAPADRRSIQKATAEQQKSAAEAAHAMLEELRAEPRKQTLDVNEAQVVAAQAALKNAQDESKKQQAAYEIDPRSVSKDALDDAINAEAMAQANLEVAQKQRDLTKAGAWTFDIRNQERHTTRSISLSLLQCFAVQIYAASANGRSGAFHLHDCRNLCIATGRL